jgi:prepilin-type N-terminal cleavage/methylation domain-containing protein
MYCRRAGIRKMGFSLIELMIAMTILLIITSFVVSAFTSSIRSMRRERALADRDAVAKRAIELMTIELGQAGVIPEFVDLKSSNGPTINNDLLVGTTSFSIQEPFRGLYPGRPLILGLPEGDTLLSERLKIANLSFDNRSVDLTSPTTLIHQVNTVSPATPNGEISSPMLPIPFGILNPPPLTINSEGKKQIPLTSLTKQVNTIGFVGDILDDGSLQYVEYTLNNGRLFRSITPIKEDVKRPFELLLDNVDIQNSSFTIVYYSSRVPIPVSVRIAIKSRSSVTEPIITGSKINTSSVEDLDRLYKSITSTTEVMPRGTYAAALIWSNGGENQLRDMLPPCSISGGGGFPPCEWNSYPWWKNVLVFSTSLP